MFHDELLEKVKKINYLPVALGGNNFQNGWIRDNLKINISKRINFMVNIHFTIGFGKMKL